MSSILINEIDADVRACVGLTEGANVVLGETALPPPDFVIEFLETYYLPMGDETIAHPFVKNFGEQALTLMEISLNPEKLIAELTEHILSFKSEIQAKLYMNRLKITFEALCDLSLICSIVEDRLIPTSEFLDEVEKLPIPEPLSEEFVKLVLASVLVDTFLQALLSLPSSVVIILLIISDLAGLTVPALPYSEAIEGNVFSVNPIGIAPKPTLDEERPQIYIPDQMQTRLYKTLSDYVSKEQHSELELLLSNKISENRIWVKLQAGSLAYIFKQAREARNHTILASMAETSNWLSAYFSWGKNNPKSVSFDTTYKVLRGNTDVTKDHQIRLKP